MDWLQKIWNDCVDPHGEEIRRENYRRECFVRVDLIPSVSCDIISGTITEVTENSATLQCKVDLTKIKGCSSRQISVAPQLGLEWIFFNIVHATQTVNGFKIGLIRI